MRLNKISYIILIALLAQVSVFAQNNRQNQRTSSSKEPEIAQQAYAWHPLWPTGITENAPMDTLEYNFFQQAIPSEISYAWICTGNMGAEGKNMLASEQKMIGNFFLNDAQKAWMPTYEKIRFYNTRIPMTLVTYNMGGGRDNSQDRLQVLFSGNMNKKAQIGVNLDYLYSKGSYANQAAKGLTWGIEGSYMGDRYEFQGSWQHYNVLNKENGGITNDLYIIDPAQIQGGVSSINPKSIPTRLSHAHTRVRGGELFMSNRYKVGYWSEQKEGDSIVSREYINTTSFFWTLNYKQGRHMFNDNSRAETTTFFEHTYLNPNITDDRSNYWEMSNVVGISLIEGFNKYAKFGLSAFARYEIRKFTQTVDTIDRSMPEEVGLTPFPEGIYSILAKKSQNLAWAGAQLSKQQGAILRYKATGEIGFLGDAAGEIRVNGEVSTRIPLFGDTVSITGFGSFNNIAAPYLMNEYISNHFIWKNDFSMERRLKFGGQLEIPWTNTIINVSTETLQNMIYFGPNVAPQQYGGGIQVLSANLDQKFKVGILHWDNKVTYQTSTNDEVLPLPKLALYSNLYILCNIATLHLQLGVDCDYYTSFYAPAYQPAIANFYNQREIKLGNYPFMNAYANMKLGRVRFYVMMSHVNQGMIGGNKYFSTPGYPLNPRRLQMGLSVDFHN